MENPLEAASRLFRGFAGPADVPRANLPSFGDVIDVRAIAEAMGLPVAWRRGIVTRTRIEDGRPCDARPQHFVVDVTWLDDVLDGTPFWVNEDAEVRIIRRASYLDVEPRTGF